MIYENYSENFEKPPTGGRPKSAGPSRPKVPKAVQKQRSTSPQGSERFVFLSMNLFGLKENRSHISERSGDTQNTNAMLDIKNNRKRAEGDLQLLTNRLALLRVSSPSHLLPHLPLSFILL
jgi:hypothetical protein